MSMRLKKIVVVAALMAIPATTNAQAADDTPESTIRAMIRALYSADVEKFRRFLLPDPRSHLLTGGQTVNKDAITELAEDPEGLQIIPRRGFEHRGIEAKRDAGGKWPVGTTVTFMVSHHRGPMVTVLEKKADGWKVDPRWWLAEIEMQSASGPKPGTPDFSARSLLFALLEGDKPQALRLATPGASAALLFDGAPSQREPSGHLEALVAEMPIVELKPGEFRRMLTGEIAEGSTSPDRKLLVGMMGSVEIPFVLRLTGSEWRVEPQPYFALINR
jgi:hypothetical protein